MIVASIKIIFAILLILISTFNSSSVYYELMELVQTKPSKEQFKLWHYVNERPYDLNNNYAILRYKSFKKNVKIITETNQQNLGFLLTRELILVFS